jgi:hypothetical protein
MLNGCTRRLLSAQVRITRLKKNRARLQLLSRLAVFADGVND